MPFAYFHVQATNAHPKKWNFRRLSGYELAGSKIFLRHGSSGDWGSLSAAWVEWSAIKGMFITWESILGRHLVLLTLFFKNIFDLLVTVRVSQGFLSLFAFPKII